MVDQKRPMVDLHEEILGVVMQKIAGHPGTLGHPIQPDPPHGTAAIDMIALDERVVRGQELEPGHIGSADPAPLGNIADGVAFNHAEYAAQTAVYSVFLAM